MLSLPGLEIYPGKRKVFRDRQEIQLTAKEYEILLLLAANKGHVLTYSQIYEKVWGDFPSGNENNTIGFHICNLREKLYQAAPNAPFISGRFPDRRNCFSCACAPEKTERDVHAAALDWKGICPQAFSTVRLFFGL